MTSKHTLDENRAIADQTIKKYGAGPLLHLINGELVPSLSHGTFENHSPGDQRRLGSVAEGGPEDIAAAAVFVASDECYMTGQNLQVNGGLTLRRNPTPAEIEQYVATAMESQA